MILAAFFSENAGNFMVAIGMIGVITILMLNLRNRRKQMSEKLDPREKLERTRQINGTKNDISHMMVELEELTRRFSAQLDAKSIQLDKLIQQADQRIAQLNNNRKATSQASLTKNITPKNTNKTSQSPMGNFFGGGEPSKPNPEADKKVTEIYQLADAGQSPIDIARQMNEQPGKVELILALRQQSQTLKNKA